MINTWKTFLTENGLSPENKLQAIQGAIVSDLSNRGLLKVSGEDAESFLQNQLSNDIRNVTESAHQISAWCSPKGRIIVSFRIFKREDCYYLSFPHDLTELVIKKLRMYVMMSKVVIEDMSDCFIQLGFAGEQAEQELQSFLDNANVPKPNETLQTKNLSILCLSGATPRFEIFTKSLDDAKALWKHCAKNATPSSSTSWDYHNIQAGLPIITAEGTGSWIPQMVNYIAIGGVDFKKGCYPGQEIVARLNYLGKTKRRMYHLLFDEEISVKTGDFIASANDDKAGEVVNAVINPDGKVEALAVVKIAEIESLKNVSILELPYPIEDE